MRTTKGRRNERVTMATEPLAVVILPYPPSVNDYWGTDWRGRKKYLKERGKVYRNDVIAIIWKQFGGRLLLRGSLRVTIGANMPDRICRNVDNICKASLDAMQHAGLYHDDNQIDDLRIVRLRPAPPGRLKIIIEGIENLPLFGGGEGQDEMQNRLDEFFGPVDVA